MYTYAPKPTSGLHIYILISAACERRRRKKKNNNYETI